MDKVQIFMNFNNKYRFFEYFSSLILYELLSLELSGKWNSYCLWLWLFLFAKFSYVIHIYSIILHHFLPFLVICFDPLLKNFIENVSSNLYLNLLKSNHFVLATCYITNTRSWWYWTIYSTWTKTMDITWKWSWNW
jgi:hypothetical protein